MSERTEGGRSMATWLIPLGLFVLAAVVRLVVAAQIPFPTTEPSAYYVNVAQNLVAGNGLVSDSVWSFATEPLVTPKPAFELWLPMSSFISALGMSVLGSTFWAAQVGGALLGALIAPLAWAIGREASHAQSLDARRAAAVAISSGLLVAVLAPFVLGSIVPDSYTPFIIFMLAAALLIPRVLGIRDGRAATPPRPASILAALTLGAILGLAYLARQEVIWLGLTVLLMAWWTSRDRSQGSRLREMTTRLWPVMAGGLVVVTPWLIRNAREFGSPFPGQAVENAFLRRNEDIFSFAQRPNLESYLDQGLATVLGNPVAAAWDGLLNVIAIAAFPLGLAGLAAVIGMRHAPALRRPTALLALLIGGALTFATTVLFFPVATRWGTFLHASGPLLVALVVTAALGGDALLARISTARRWDRPNVILAPLALLSVALLLAFLQVRIFAQQSVDTEARYGRLAASIRAVAEADGGTVPATIITDRPVWLASALDGAAVALPDEEVGSILRLGALFDTRWVVVIDERGRYPQSLLSGPGAACLARDPVALSGGAAPSWLFVLEQDCEPA
ncbi:MAG: ArnT family glycosyltransferase [Chloroflexota bacterium]